MAKPDLQATVQVGLIGAANAVKEELDQFAKSIHDMITRNNEYNYKFSQVMTELTAISGKLKNGDSLKASDVKRLDAVRKMLDKSLTKVNNTNVALKAQGQHKHTADHIAPTQDTKRPKFRN